MIEHPFVNFDDLESKSIEELLTTINNLNNKLVYVRRMNNFQMANQIHMVLTNYRHVLNKKQQELWNKQGGKDTEKKINIT